VCGRGARRFPVLAYWSGPFGGSMAHRPPRATEAVCRRVLAAGRTGPPRERAMARRMLIDASHPEETRVVVVDGTRLEEFDFETASRKPLKGNIYLAKVIRIEPSLHAAFVEYGATRHGFLAFSDIHPDYYQIPVADRERLIAEQQRLQAEAEDEPEPPRKVDRTDIEEVKAENLAASEALVEAAAPPPEPPVEEAPVAEVPVETAYATEEAPPGEAAAEPPGEAAASE